MREVLKNKNNKHIMSKDEIIREMEAMLWFFIAIVCMFLLIIIYYIGEEQQHEQSSYQRQTSVSNIAR
jgi:cytochrome bd-type quinol oxidase subunit 1